MAGKKGVDDEKRKKTGDGADRSVRGFERDAGYATGYETDGASTSGKSRSKLRKKTRTRKPSTLGDAGYETDDGYMSAAPKSKSRFFKLGNRSKTSLDDHHRPPVDMPPPPLPPVFRLPIAEKFARTLGDINANATMEPPLGPLGVPNPPFAAATPPSSFTPSSVSILIPNDADKDSVDTHEPSVLGMTTSKRNVVHVHFASSDSDHNGTSSMGSSAGHSLFSKISTSSSGSSPTSASPPKPKMVISYPLTRSPSPPSPPVIQPVVIPNLNKSSTKRVSGPLFLHRVPSDQGKLLGSYLNSNSNSGNRSPDWSPADSAFVVVTPNPAATPSPTAANRPGLLRPGTTNTNSSETVMKLQLSPIGSRDISPARSQNDGIIPSSDYIVPSPRATSPLTPPNALSHYDLPPPSPPPTGPLPKPPVDAGDNSQSDFAAQQRSHRQRWNLPPPMSTPLRSASPLLAGSTPKRGRESPFPTRPVLPNGNTRSGSGFESRVRVRRYRDLYAVPPNGWEDGSSESHRESDTEYTAEQPRADFRRHAFRQSVNVGIQVEVPSDDEGYGGEGTGDHDESDEEIRNVLSRFRRDESRNRWRGSDDEEEFEAALERRRSLQASKDSFLDPSYSPRGRAYGRGQMRGNKRQGSASPSAFEGEGEGDYSDSDDKSRYPDDVMTAGRTTMYRFDNGSSRGTGTGTSRRSLSLESDGRSRRSFLDAEKSEQARQRFLRKVEAMYDENGREVSSLGVGRGTTAVPPVPRLPKAATQAPKGWF